MFRTVPLSMITSFSLYTQQWYTTYVIQVCWQLASRIRTELSPCSQAVSKPVWHIPLLCIQWKTRDDGQRNCPKHVEFYYKNKFEKIVLLVGSIIRIYHDARALGRQNGLVSVQEQWRCLAKIRSTELVSYWNVKLPNVCQDTVTGKISPKGRTLTFIL